MKKIESSEALEKGKQGAVRIVFGRTFVIFALLIIQVVLMLWGLIRLTEIWYAFTLVMTVLALILVIHIINKPENNPAYKIAWIVVILALPIFGASLYLFVESQFTTKWLNGRILKLHKEMREYVKQEPEVAGELAQENEQMGNLAHYMAEDGGYPVYRNSGAKYFPTGEAKFEELKKQLMEAKSFIFIEYFIVNKGYMWDSVLEILKAKAQEGVEVRFMYDGTNMVSRLPYRYPQELESYGIKCRVFASIKPAVSTVQNNRDHRKIVVIDGQTAFTGGINLADEYINKKERFGYWKDTGIMVKGEAVRSFTMMFLEMWNAERLNSTDDYARYLNVPVERTPEEGDGFVLPYGDSPLDNENVGEAMYMDILNTAKHYVHIMTPYLILDNEMITALKYAAKRGVDVKIIMPHIPDKKYAFVLAKTYYNELLDSGVQIYEFEPGFVHAKSFVSDDEKAVVGTINLDYRSLYLHFECAVMLYQNAAIPSVEEDFQETLKQCITVTKEDYKKQKWYEKMGGKVLRLIAPLM
ncbi:MAG: cardiolipin synthase [Eubacteriales bacterium]|nr:cardiolipin synthase [Eubacteriales bacterium]